MKYLYGDSVPCPIQYNFLTAFETFIDAAAQTVRLDQEIAQVEAKIAAGVASRERALEIVEEFHRKAMASLEKLREQYDDPNSAAYARQVREHADTLVTEARTNCKLANDKEAKEHGSEFDRRRKEISSAIERFLKTDLMPVLGWSVTMRLTDGQNQLTAILSHPGDVITSFSIGTGQAPSWQSPVRVASLVQGLDLQLGVRKSWITGSVARSAVSLDDYLIGGFELGDDTAEIRLRKRAEQPDAFVFKLERKAERLLVQLQRPGEEDDTVTDLDEEDRARLEKLWQMLRQSVKTTLRFRTHLLSVRVGGQDLFEAKRLRPFLERVIESIAPIVQQIIEHSPNPNELSMKIESDEGRREEVYVRRESLIAKIEVLDDAGRAVFAPMGLVPEALTSADVDIEV
jgi:hypothetical protein